MTFLWLTLASVLGWFSSTLAGGGSSLILMPMVGFFLGVAAIAPTISLGAIIGNAERSFVYRKKINWKVIQWELPGAIVGALIGAFSLTKFRLEWVTIVVALFLILSALVYVIKLLNNQTASFQVRSWYFLPAGFIYAFLSGLIGSMGPLLAPFYLNYGLEKEELLGTQAMNRMVVHVVKVIAYAWFGILTYPYVAYGLLLGIAAFPGNWLGHLALDKISEQRFRQLVISFVMFSGILLLWQQRDFWAFW